MVDLPEFDDLVQPVALLAFEGWNDAGDAATDSIRYLAAQVNAELIGAIDGEEFFDYQDQRPVLERNAAGGATIHWPKVEIYRFRPSGWGRDVIAFVGSEPNLRWKAFAKEVMEVVALYQIKSVYVLGSMLSDSPHSRPLPVSITTNRPGTHPSATPSDYSGPVSVSAIITAAAAALTLDSVALWVSVPHYVSDPPSPKAMLALLNSLAQAVDEPINIDSLREDVSAWQRGADEAVGEDEGLREYVAALENEIDVVDLPSASGESIAADFERYLRQRGNKE